MPKVFHLQENKMNSQKKRGSEASGHGNPRFLISWLKQQDLRFTLWTAVATSDSNMAASIRTVDLLIVDLHCKFSSVETLTMEIQIPPAHERRHFPYCGTKNTWIVCFFFFWPSELLKGSTKAFQYTGSNVVWKKINNKPHFHWQCSAPYIENMLFNICFLPLFFSQACLELVGYT